LRHEAVDDNGRENLDGFRNEEPEKGRNRSCDNIANPRFPVGGAALRVRVMENGLSEVRVLSMGKVEAPAA